MGKRVALQGVFSVFHCSTSFFTFIFFCSNNTQHRSNNNSTQRVHCTNLYAILVLQSRTSLKVP